VSRRFTGRIDFQIGFGIPRDRTESPNRAPYSERGRKQYARGAQLVQLVYCWIAKSIPNPHLRT
jgi:hypothetical protein